MGLLFDKEPPKKAKQKKREGGEPPSGLLYVPPVASHFFDSGSFTLWTEAHKYAKEHGCDEWAYYDTEAFWAYVDSYAGFVKKYRHGIDLYANVDVIPHPRLSWRNQRYLEKKHGLSPVPVVHYRTPMKWLRHYVDRGYEVIALGGLVGSSDTTEGRQWIERCFDTVCDPKTHLPKVKLHGFGFTSFDLIVRYPWWSVDSTTWSKIGGYGSILVPHRKAGGWRFDVGPYVVPCALDGPTMSRKGKHYLTMSKPEQRTVRDWLGEIGVHLGEWDDRGRVLEYGVVTRHTDRRTANLLFFERVRKTIPPWPWPFKPYSRREPGLGVT